MRVEVADASKNDLGMTREPVAFEIDNSTPNGIFTEIAWRPVGSGGWTVLPTICPVVERPAAHIEFRVSWSASAPFPAERESDGGGCGTGDPVWPSGAPASNYESWRPTGTDMSVSRTAYFLLANVLTKAFGSRS